MKELLALRKSIKKKKPDFIRQDAHKKPRLKKKWKRPRGIHSKIRLNKKGYRRSVRKGYGSPSKVYGLHPSGLKEILVTNFNDFEKITNKHGAVISAKVGMKKRIELLKKAKELGIVVLNFDIDKFLKGVEEKQKARKEEKEKKKKKKVVKKKEKEKKVEEKKKEEKLAEKLTEEEKKEKEKEEKEKVLTKKEI